jgi:hypothetical protein
MSNEVTKQRDIIKNRLATMFDNMQNDVLNFRDFNLSVNLPNFIKDLKSTYIENGVRILISCEAGLKLNLENVFKTFNITCKVLDGSITTSSKLITKDCNIKNNIEFTTDATIMLTFRKIA